MKPWEFTEPSLLEFKSPVGKLLYRDAIGRRLKGSSGKSWCSPLSLLIFRIRELSSAGPAASASGELQASPVADEVDGADGLTESLWCLEKYFLISILWVKRTQSPQVEQWMILMHILLYPRNTKCAFQDDQRWLDLEIMCSTLFLFNLWSIYSDLQNFSFDRDNQKMSSFSFLMYYRPWLMHHWMISYMINFFCF